MAPVPYPSASARARQSAIPAVAAVALASAAPFLYCRLHPVAPPVGLLIAVVILLAPVAVSFRLGRRFRHGGDIVILLCVVALSGSAGSMFPAPRPVPVGIPEIFVRCRIGESRGRTVARSVACRHDARWVPIGGAFLVPSWEGSGGSYEGPAFLVSWDEPRLPGLADRGRAGRLSGLRGTLLISERHGALARRGPPGWRLRWRERLRTRIGDSLPEPLQNLMPGFLWGERMAEDAALDRTFRATGTLHLLAISGLHITLIAFLLDFLARVAIRRAWVRLACVAAGLGFYGALVGPLPSVVRALVMGTVFLASRAVGRPGVVGPAWWTSLLACVFFTPEEAVRPGMQLSFAGAAALFLAPRPPHRVLQPVWYSAMAVAATSGILWAHFGETSPMAVVANIAGVPGFAPVLVSMLWGMVWGNPQDALLQSLAWGPANVLSEAWIAPLRMLAPAGERIALRVVPGEFLGLLITAAVFALLLAPRLPAARLRVGACAAAALLAAGCVARCTWHADAPTEVAMLSVGQGDAVLCRSEGRSWLIDTGPPGSDGLQGKRALAPALRSLGVRRLACVVLTHGDDDHCGGLRGLLLAGIGVDTLLVSSHSEYRLSLPRSRVPVVRRLLAPHRLVLPGGVADVVHPYADAPAGSGNEGSVALRVQLDGLRLLLPGDLGKDGEERVLAHAGAWPCDVLLAGHHGSRHSTSQAWLDSLNPRIAVLSSGPRNRYGHPSPETCDRLASSGAAILRTDRLGTIRFRRRDAGWSVGSCRAEAVVAPWNLCYK